MSNLPIDINEIEVIYEEVKPNKTITKIIKSK